MFSSTSNKTRSMLYRLILHVFIPLVGILLWAVFSNGLTEWDCAVKSGIFDKTVDCTLSSLLYVDGVLSIVGDKNRYGLSLVKIRAAPSKSHFVLQTNDKLTL